MSAAVACAVCTGDDVLLLRLRNNRLGEVVLYDLVSAVIVLGDCIVECPRIGTTTARISATGGIDTVERLCNPLRHEFLGVVANRVVTYVFCV